jgi:hypothetical protein
MKHFCIMMLFLTVSIQQLHSAAMRENHIYSLEKLMSTLEKELPHFPLAICEEIAAYTGHLPGKYRLAWEKKLTPNFRSCVVRALPNKEFAVIAQDGDITIFDTNSSNHVSSFYSKGTLPPEYVNMGLLNHGADTSSPARDVEGMKCLSQDSKGNCMITAYRVSGNNKETFGYSIPKCALMFPKRDVQRFGVIVPGGLAVSRNGKLMILDEDGKIVQELPQQAVCEVQYTSYGDLITSSVRCKKQENEVATVSLWRPVSMQEERKKRKKRDKCIKYTSVACALFGTMTLGIVKGFYGQ